ncbi:hypothetical protein [Halobacteriovorax sp. DA5]|uniref:hypothetical protein n=1 Tax=Halobacteriovorax sp. DA5 TaxID=2067553 RepID=UPI000CD10887|nr:hypothetical protein [Halobacteriovorax sp. DA5]POB13812.1 hypothetical protein C0Z22_07070 [Halobacteriovorax sp. DA5]
MKFILQLFLIFHLSQVAHAFDAMSRGPASIDPTPTYKEHEVSIIQGHFRHQYFRYFLEEILTLSRSDFGDFKVKSLECGNEKECVESGAYKKGDIIYSPSENWDLADFKKIEAPILSGLMGLRLPVYEYKDRMKFEAIKSPEEYKKKRVSFNKNWRDYKILEKSKFKLIAVETFDDIYGALTDSRADYTLRGVSEAFIEVLNQKENLLIDTKNFIYYSYPVYLYVRKTNKRLYRALILGMKKMESQSYNNFTRSFVGQNLVLDERESCKIYNVNTEVVQVLKQCELKGLIEAVANFNRN